MLLVFCLGLSYFLLWVHLEHLLSRSHFSLVAGLLFISKLLSCWIDYKSLKSVLLAFSRSLMPVFLFLYVPTLTSLIALSRDVPLQSHLQHLLLHLRFVPRSHRYLLQNLLRCNHLPRLQLFNISFLARSWCLSFLNWLFGLLKSRIYF